MELTCRLPQRLDEASLAPLREQLLVRAERGVLVLTGASDECFCDGMHLSHVRAAAGPHATLQEMTNVLLQLVESSVPTIAVVRGAARGGGIGLAAACDCVLASEGATFALPELLFGLVPATIWPILEQRVLVARLRQWALSGHAVPAAEACNAGLVDVVVAEEEIAHRLKRQVRLFSRVRSEAVQRLRRLNDPNLPDRIRQGAAATASLLQEPDVAKAIAAFENGEAPWLD